jgi:integrase
MIQTENDKATAEWFNSLKKRTRQSYNSFWRYFMEFTGKNGDQILADRKADCLAETHKWERTVLEFKRWILENKRLSPNTATTAAMAVRGFFAFHYVPLQYRRQERRTLAETKRKTEDYLFTVEDLKRMADVANLKEKYVVIAGKSFGLRASDFLRLTRGDLEPYIDRKVPISIGKMNTIKENVPAYPFIDTDAQPVIKIMIQRMNRKGRTKPSERMLTYKRGKELTAVLKRLADWAGLKTGNKRVRFHCLRKFLIDNISSLMSESKWKQIVGKKISESAYVSPDSLREDYERAMSKTVFTKAAEGDVEKLAKRMTLMTIAKNAGLIETEDEMKAIWQSRKALTLDAQIKVLEEMTRKDANNSATASTCKNGNCQRIVSEADLGGLLAQGWRVAAVLPSGKIVVSNE